MINWDRISGIIVTFAILRELYPHMIWALTLSDLDEVYGLHRGEILISFERDKSLIWFDGGVDKL